MESLHGVDDAHAFAFRVRMLRTGIWPSLFTTAYCFVYLGLTWDHPHRPLLVGVSLLATVGSLVIARSPIERLFGGRWCEPFFLGWSASVIAAIAGGVALDGGVSSPLTPLFFVPLVYSALSYPLKSMLAVGAMTLTAYVGIALAAGGVSEATILINASALCTVTWICAWQALNHAHQRRELNEVSRTDPLTGCLNRRGFAERFGAALADRRRGVGQVGLILFDLDGFKAVNDAHGHAVGDELLCWVVACLAEGARPGDAIGRLGGDEFGVLLADAGADALLVKQRLIAALAERTGASAGVAVFPLDGADEEALHRSADAGLYADKVDMPAQPAGDRAGAATESREHGRGAKLMSAMDR